MKLTDADIQSFITAYQADFGETISPADAREMATRVLAVFRLLATDPASETDVQVP
jgi:hypothetical protein